jgi:hypothetical protein
MNIKNCKCCKTNINGSSGVLCSNCWKWITEEIEMEDITLMVAMLSRRKPENKHAREISVYLVADNYMHGMAKLVEKIEKKND